MKEVGRYFSYDEAHGWRLELLAAGIDCRVEYQATGISLMGGTEVYTVLVEPSDFARAQEILSAPAIEGDDPIMKCPRCGSTDVMQVRSLGRLPGLLQAAITHEGAPSHQLLSKHCSNTWDLT